VAPSVRSRSLSGVKNRRRQEEERQISDEASYVCGSCGEEIVVPLDPSGGESQQ